jgi:transcription elongation GreA/GreB family factor
MNNTALKDKINALNNEIIRLKSMIFQASSAANEAQKEANYHIGAMQSRYDTFKEEAQYLAEAQKLRILTLKDKLFQSEELIKKFQSNLFNENVVCLGSLVCLEFEDGERMHYFLVPDGTGQTVKINTLEAICISPEAPIAIPLVGGRLHDEIEIFFRGKKKLAVIELIL